MQTLSRHINAGESINTHIHSHCKRSLGWLGEYFSDPLSSEMRVHVEINKQFISMAKGVEIEEQSASVHCEKRVLAERANKPRQNEKINNPRRTRRGHGGMANGKTWNSYLKIRPLPRCWDGYIRKILWGTITWMRRHCNVRTGHNAEARRRNAATTRTTVRGKNKLIFYLARRDSPHAMPRPLSYNKTKAEQDAPTCILFAILWASSKAH